MSDTVVHVISEVEPRGKLTLKFRKEVSTVTLGRIKTKLATITGLSEDKQVLKYHGKVLSDETTFGQLGYHSDDFIILEQAGAGTSYQTDPHYSNSPAPSPPPPPVQSFQINDSPPQTSPPQPSFTTTHNRYPQDPGPYGPPSSFSPLPSFTQAPQNYTSHNKPPYARYEPHPINDQTAIMPLLPSPRSGYSSPYSSRPQSPVDGYSSNRPLAWSPVDANPLSPEPRVRRFQPDYPNFVPRCGSPLPQPMPAANAWMQKPPIPYDMRPISPLPSPSPPQFYQYPPNSPNRPSSPQHWQSYVPPRMPPPMPPPQPWGVPLPRSPPHSPRYPPPPPPVPYRPSSPRMSSPFHYRSISPSCECCGRPNYDLEYVNEYEDFNNDFDYQIEEKRLAWEQAERRRMAAEEAAWRTCEELAESRRIVAEQQMALEQAESRFVRDPYDRYPPARAPIASARERRRMPTDMEVDSQYTHPAYVEEANVYRVRRYNARNRNDPIASSPNSSPLDKDEPEPSSPRPRN